LCTVRLPPLPDSFQEAGMIGVEALLQLRWVAARSAFEDLLVFRHHLALVFFNIAKRRQHLMAADAELSGNGRMVLAGLCVIQHVEDRDPRAGDLRSPAPINDGWLHSLLLYCFAAF
jgi:hypothetical protein